MMPSSTNTSNGLYAKAEIKQKVLAVWERVFQASNKVIKDAKNYGFRGMDLAPDPNIHDLIVSAKMLEQSLTVLIDQAEQRDDFESVRMLLNAKQQLLRLERLGNELIANNEKGFNELLGEINAQAVF